MKGKTLYLIGLFLCAAILPAGPRILAQPPEDSPIVNPSTAMRFSPVPNAPECFTVGVERGDPTKGPSVILAKFTPGCIAPWHWHTPSETVMMVSGALQAQMKGAKTLIAHHGDFLYLPSHHVHRASCLGPAPCLVFLSADAAFDIHWVDAAGREISMDAALKSAKPAVAAKAKRH